MKALGFPFHQQTVQRVEAGERPVRLDEAYAIAEILDSSVESMTRVYRSDFADVVYAVEKLRRESGNTYQAVLEVFDDWHEAFEELYAEFARSVPQSGEVVDERAVLTAAWVLKGLWAFESLNELLGDLVGLASDDEGEDWHSPVLTRDVPDTLSWLQDETAEPWASMPEKDRPPYVADLHPKVLLDRLRELGTDSEHQATS